LPRPDRGVGIGTAATGTGPAPPPLHLLSKEDVVIAIGTVLLVLLLWAAWRRAAWGVAVLGIAVGLSASGPVADGINAAIKAGTALATSLQNLV
jgi:hypothetical protein